MTPEQQAHVRDDCRRAAAIAVHHGRGDVEGVNAIITEVIEANRPTQLLIAVLDLYQYLVPELRTQMGMALLSAAVTELAGMDVGEK